MENHRHCIQVSQNYGERRKNSLTTIAHRNYLILNVFGGNENTNHFANKNRETKGE